MRISTGWAPATAHKAPAGGRRWIDHKQTRGKSEWSTSHWLLVLLRTVSSTIYIPRLVLESACDSRSEDWPICLLFLCGDFFTSGKKVVRSDLMEPPLQNAYVIIEEFVLPLVQVVMCPLKWCVHRFQTLSLKWNNCWLSVMKQWSDLDCGAKLNNPSA